MTDETRVYEPPALIEAGDFTELTLGVGPYPRLDLPNPFLWL